ncbi:hypothetical protein QRX50_24720 [Amycolatopsis carbonis]|uniref:Nitroreductase n=1 Tax=Amycolatopsis carbonis TaxID=715471 RepID=A0A9Y2IS07_9PSEU|nr:hypothetical protein [Amycolatopsis sp. 2-15]WIX83733.1 hypothetical protein QRX50_24720 [Amycolatopsis sp. 2-15]
MNDQLPTAFDQALAAAVRAPSPHNTQPWRFVVDGDAVEVWLDRDRVLAVADPAAREARVSCGAAVLNLVITLRVNGLGARVRILPGAALPDLLAVIGLDGTRRSTEQDRGLAEAVHRRHTNRRPFADRAVPAVARARLKSAALSEGGQLEFLDASGRYPKVAALVRRAESLQAEDPAFRAESAFWTGRAAESPDGVPTVAFGPRYEIPGVVCHRASHTNPAVPSRAFEQDPLLAVVLTRDHGAAADVRAGMVMQRVLLTATAEGLAASFLSQPLEVHGIREQFLELFRGLGQVHALLRIGYGHATRMTARRPAAEVTAQRAEPDVPAV